MSRKEDMEIGKAAGANAYLTKPIDEGLLLRSIEDLLK
jgi:CheY-like chemotaxis protein